MGIDTIFGLISLTTIFVIYWKVGMIKAYIRIFRKLTNQEAK